MFNASGGQDARVPFEQMKEFGWEEWSFGRVLMSLACEMAVRSMNSRGAEELEQSPVL